MDSEPERRAFMEAMFAEKAPELTLTRWPAVVADAQMSAGQGVAYQPHLKNSARWELMPSEIGCFESHRQIWAHILDHCPGGAVICEDDILLSETFSKVIAKLPLERLGLIKLDGFNASKRYGALRHFGALGVRGCAEMVPSTACYALSQAHAAQLLERSSAYCDTADDFISKPTSEGPQAWQVEPAPVVQAMCVHDGQGQLPARVRQSARNTTSKAPRQRNKGPLRYRLGKEWRRIRTKLANRLYADAGLIRSGGRHGMPELAPDLGRYIQ